MKVLKLSLFLFAILSITACGDDDEMAVCSQSDWVGTYSGTITCVEDGDTDTEDVTVTITASGADNIIISYEVPSLTTTTDPFPISNCSVNETASDQGLTVSLSADIDGDNLTYVETFSFGGASSSCTIEATRD